VKHALLKGRPWKGVRWVLWNHVESIGTKGYTQREIREMLAPMGLADVRCVTYLTGADRVARNSFPFSLWNGLVRLASALSGGRLGWFHAISARKL
jgi:hypothetical protein